MSISNQPVSGNSAIIVTVELPPMERTAVLKYLNALGMESSRTWYASDQVPSFTRYTVDSITDCRSCVAVAARGSEIALALIHGTLCPVSRRNEDELVLERAIVCHAWHNDTYATIDWMDMIDG
jgi:hypothetical protein